MWEKGGGAEYEEQRKMTVRFADAHCVVVAWKTAGRRKTSDTKLFHLHAADADLVSCDREYYWLMWI